jgi:hypothetical protein
VDVDGAADVRTESVAVVAIYAPLLTNDALTAGMGIAFRSTDGESTELTDGQESDRYFDSVQVRDTSGLIRRHW